MISRREFVTMTGAAVAMSHSLFAAEKVPTMLDHLLLGCSDLDAGIAFVEKHTGVKPALGGVHPGRGTRNALLALGPLHYLEVIAPDPAQSEVPKVRAELPAMLKKLASPTLVDWAVHTSDIVGVAERWEKAHVPFQGPTPGSRARPDGKMLHWQTLNVVDDRDGLIPFFIQWGADTTHPSVDAPSGCKLESFAVVTSESARLEAEFEKLGISVEVASGKTACLRAKIAGPRGMMLLGG
jgi:catechol 2,3-dioxygenase-like lactoylglutathione lyase family enzyme